MAATTTNRAKLGLFVVLGIAAGFAGLLWIGGRRFHKEAITSITYFDESVQGLDVGSPVKFRGVKVGSVADISVAPDRRHVEVTSTMYLDVLKRLGLNDLEGEEAPMPPGMRMQLVSAGITGVKFIETDFFDPQRNPVEKLPFELPKNYTPSVPSTLKSVEQAVVEATNYVPVIASQTSAVLARIDKTLVDLDTAGLSSRAKSLMDEVDKKLGEIDTATLGRDAAAAVHDARDALEAMRKIAQDPVLKEILEHGNGAVQGLERSLKEADVGKTSESVRSTSLALGEAARSLAEMDDEIKQGIVVFRETLEAVHRLADLLERDPSSLIHGRSPEALPASVQKP